LVQDSYFVEVQIVSNLDKPYEDLRLVLKFAK